MHLTRASGPEPADKTACIKHGDEGHRHLKRIGIWSFAFFATKGLLWIIISFSVYLGTTE